MPRSADATTLDPINDPISNSNSGPPPWIGIRHTAAGRSQLPSLNAVGLFIITPSDKRTGSDQEGFFRSGSSVQIPQTPPLPAQK